MSQGIWWLLETRNSPQLTASKKWVDSPTNPKELNSANKLNEQETNLRAFRKEYSLSAPWF